MKHERNRSDALVTGQFLIASPSLDDTNFSHSVVLVCEHTEDGAFGLIVNKILMNSITPLMKDFEIGGSVADLPVHFGGPVRPEFGYVIYSPFDERYQSIIVTPDIAVTTSKEILHDIAAGKGPRDFVFALGFSGWGANQLESELMEDSWIVAPLDGDVIFHVPVSERWRYAAGLIGVDFGRYSERSGNA